MRLQYAYHVEAESHSGTSLCSSSVTWLTGGFRWELARLAETIRDAGSRHGVNSCRQVPANAVNQATAGDCDNVPGRNLAKFLAPRARGRAGSWTPQYHSYVRGYTVALFSTGPAPLDMNPTATNALLRVPVSFFYRYGNGGGLERGAL